VASDGRATDGLVEAESCASQCRDGAGSPRNRAAIPGPAKSRCAA